MPTIYLYPGLSPANNVELTDPTTLSTPPASVTIDSTVALPFNGLGSWLTEDLGQEWLTEITGEAWLVEVNHLAEFANVIDATVTASAETGAAGSLAETLTSTVTASAETGSASVAAETLSVAVTASSETASDAVAEETLAVSIEASAETGSDSLADAVEPETAPEEEGVGIVALDWPRPKRRSRPPAPEPRYVPWLDPYIPWLEVARQEPVTEELPTPAPSGMAALVGAPGQNLPIKASLPDTWGAELADRLLNAQDIWEAVQRRQAVQAAIEAVIAAQVAADADDEEALFAVDAL